ncbi:tripartite tricarboxylate transporter substrate binding protein [Streptomonospora halophila]|uniref:Tripartite tricarboxylate transporter substrate binding protein n=1 Tax=Streptomonospora halophila TaxID=427369 RepID=A0ABP9GFG4_9ACTN
MFRTLAARLAAPVSVCASLALVATGCGSGGSDGGGDGAWAPEKPIEMVAPAATGGGWDTLARTSSRVLEQNNLVDQPIQVVNKPGGGGAVGWAYVAGAPEPTRLFVTSPPITLVPLTSQSSQDHDDFTPISRLMTEYMVFAVPADSPLKSMGDLVDKLKDDPSSLSVAGGSAPGSMDHVAFAGAMNKAGIDPRKLKYVPYDGGGEALTQAIGGHVDAAVTGVSEAAGLVESGDLRALAVSAPERTETLPDVPTLRDEGVDYTYDVWRGVMGPGDMTDAQVAYYEKAFKRMVEQEDWKSEAKKLGWETSYMDSQEFGSFLDKSSKDAENLLGEIGLRKEQG